MRNLKYMMMVLLGGTLYGTMSSVVKLSFTMDSMLASIAFMNYYKLSKSKNDVLR